MYATIGEAIKDSSEAIAPVSPLIMIISSFTNLPLETSAIILNAIFLTRIIDNFHNFTTPLMTKSLTSSEYVISIIVSCLLFPSTAILIISANKDVCIAYALSEFFYRFSEVKLKKNEIQNSTKNLILAALSFALVQQLRPYFSSFLAIAMIIYLSLRVPIKLNRNLAILTFFTLAYICSYLAIITKWESIRVVVESYSGRATIWPAFLAERPTAITGLAYPILSAVYLLFYPITLGLTNPDISDLNIVIGAIHAFFFIIGTTLLLFKIRRNQKKFDLLIIFVLIHYLIQPWGSPNVGALMRLTLFEVMIFSTLIACSTKKTVTMFIHLTQERFTKNGACTCI